MKITFTFKTAFNIIWNYERVCLSLESSKLHEKLYVFILFELSHWRTNNSVTWRTRHTCSVTNCILCLSVSLSLQTINITNKKQHCKKCVYASTEREIDVQQVDLFYLSDFYFHLTHKRQESTQIKRKVWRLWFAMWATVFQRAIATTTPMSKWPRWEERPPQREPTIYPLMI